MFDEQVCEVSMSKLSQENSPLCQRTWRDRGSRHLVSTRETPS